MRVEPEHQEVWDWRAAVQFIGGGTGTGLLFWTALAAWQEPAWLGRTGWPALAFIAAGLLFVWLKLGRRWRAMFVILNPRTSWMSREALLSLPLMGLGLAAAFFRLPALGAAAAFTGLCFLYAQARMLRAARGIPAWREPLIVPLIFSTGLTEGASLLLMAVAAGRLLQPAADQAEAWSGAGTWLPGALLLLLAVRLTAWTVYRRTLCAPGAAPVRAAAVLARANRIILGAGHLLPILLLGVTTLPALPGPAALAPLPALLAGLAALLGGWFLKFTVVARAAYNQGFALVRTPARTPGHGGAGTKPGWR